MTSTYRDTPYLSVIIPAFNEAERIHGTLEQIAKHLAQCRFSSEIFVVDDGSTDGTAEIAMSARVGTIPVTILHHETNSGKGYAVQQGALRARGEVLLICDADLSIPIDELATMLHRMQDGFDLVIASRALPDSRATENQPPHRVFLGRLLNLLVRWLLLEDICDTQCGFKLINRRAAEAIFPCQRIVGFAFDIELLFLAQRSGFAIAEVPVRWHHVSPSHVRLIRDGLQMGIDVLRIRWLWRNGSYGPRSYRDSRGRSAPRREGTSPNGDC
jgi:dolichyl-phosphate beta-glucosyltransferase